MKNSMKVVIAVGTWLGLNALILWGASTLRQVVVDSWKKGPLIDPAAPYAPENAQWYFAILMCWILNAYVLGLFGLSKFRSTSKVWWAPMLLLIGVLGIGEIGFRTYLSKNQTTHFRPHPTLHWMCRPNLKNFVSQGDGIVLNTNHLGMREVTATYEKAADELRVLVLGDSSNFGQGVSGTEMWSSQLEIILEENAQQSVTVLNAACPGWTTYQGLEVVREYGLKFQPDIIIAGFNNDAGPDFMTDRERVSSSKSIRAIQGVLYQAETFVIAREAILAWFRKMSSTAQDAYALRLAGEKSKYGKLDSDERLALVSRVPLEEMKQNLLTLQTLAKDNGAEFVWVNMPINRKEPEFVQRYVDWTYRNSIETFTKAESIPYVGVDEYWLKSRESNLHLLGHVFHPNAQGHRRMAEQIADQILREGLIDEVSGSVTIASPPIADTTDVLRFGWSSKTPIHAHLGVALQRHPELIQAHGLEIELIPFQSGKEQGTALAEGRLDAWFSCAVPAIHMLDARPDSKVVASFGSLGKIRWMSPLDSSNVSSVGMTEGSTPHMQWNLWHRDVSDPIQLRFERTDGLEDALLSQSVNSLVMWDPWAMEWAVEHGWATLQEDPFYSVLIVAEMWALGDVQDPRVPRLMALFRDLIQVIQLEGIEIDVEVAALGDWDVETVRSIREQNAVLSAKTDFSVSKEVLNELKESRRFVYPNSRGFFSVAEEWQHGLPKVQP